MANKNRTGTLYTRAVRNEDYLIDRIDRREADGSNRENVDDTYNKCRINEDGERCWSF